MLLYRLLFRLGNGCRRKRNVFVRLALQNSCIALRLGCFILLLVSLGNLDFALLSQLLLPSNDLILRLCALFFHSKRVNGRKACEELFLAFDARLLYISFWRPWRRNVVLSEELVIRVENG